MNAFSRLVPLGLASLAFGTLVACSPFGHDGPTDDGADDNGSLPPEKANQIRTDLDLAQVNLSGVKQIALTDDSRMAFVAGELGANREAVIGAFAQGSDVELLKHQVDELGFTHETFNQTLNGLPLVGGNIRVARNAEGNVVAASGVSTRPSDITSATVLVSNAKNLALSSSPGSDNDRFRKPRLRCGLEPFAHSRLAI